ncbi:HD domain-containing phosphohydrolase [Paenibacillus arenosi]|uniref:HD-GYP domain-containing protein n=1 Tax=Paenibacillus arenosi TaxID=2774142 RepID=A0ABR9B1L3_9BACL|nr:HD-GYP domain-containing protein [Paenibacillus arenosi]
MRWIPIMNCRPGMRLAKKIYNEEGMVLLQEQVEMTDTFIRRLIERDVSYIYVEDERTEGIVAPDLLSDETRIMANKTIRQQFMQHMSDGRARKRRPDQDMDASVSGMLDNLVHDISKHNKAMVMLNDIQTTDHYVYRHSLNVCVYSTLFGVYHGYERDDLKMLSMGALLHDVGKMHLDPHILNKTSPLTKLEFDMIKKHAEYGYRILRKDPNIPTIVAHCAYQHHERLNGSGYPRGLTSDNIHEFAKWIAIADSYDAMTTNRVYRPAMLPHEALEILYTGSGTLYEQWMLSLFRDRIAVYPLGMTVKLSTGEIGIVAEINSDYPQRPMIRVLYDAEGASVPLGTELDLSQLLHIMIVEMVDVE